MYLHVARAMSVNNACEALQCREPTYIVDLLL